MEGERTLRRPWRGWLSTLASGCALAIALALMSLADSGGPASRPTRIVAGPPVSRVNHQGDGNALLPPPKVSTPTPTPTPSQPSQSSTRASRPPTTAPAAAPDASLIVEDVTVTEPTSATTTTTTTVPTTPTISRTPITLPGGPTVEAVHHPQIRHTAHSARDIERAPRKKHHPPKPKPKPKHKRGEDADADEEVLKLERVLGFF